MTVYVNAIDEDTVELRLPYYMAGGGYSVRLVPEDEGEYIGDGMIDYDGSLGKYRVLITFGDAGLSHALIQRLTPREYLEIKAGSFTMRLRRAHPSDHGFVLYVGFDEPITVDAVEHGELDSLWGTVSVLIHRQTEE